MLLTKPVSNIFPRNRNFIKLKLPVASPLLSVKSPSEVMRAAIHANTSTCVEKKAAVFNDAKQTGCGFHFRKNTDRLVIYALYSSPLVY